MRQTMIDSSYCLDLVVPERTSPVAGVEAIGGRNRKRRALDTRIGNLEAFLLLFSGRGEGVSRRDEHVVGNFHGQGY